MGLNRFNGRRFVALSLLLAAAALARADESVTLLESFDAPLDPARWAVVRVNDVRSDRIEAQNGTLVVALETLGTDDRTVKVRGVSSQQAFTIGTAPVRISTNVDWNGQANGCYLSAGMALVPEGYATDKDPRAAPEGVYFEWIGVPPGKRVRPYLVKRSKNAALELYTEGWPQPKREDRVGRPASKAKISLEVAKDSVRLAEGEKELYKGADGLSGRFKLVLFVTGHSNYPTRTVYFDSASVAEVRSGS
jgi:hypothetical protein